MAFPDFKRAINFPTFPVANTTDDPVQYLQRVAGLAAQNYSRLAVQVNNMQSSLHGSPPGTVTSVAATVPAELSVSGSPITTAGTLAFSWATEAANKVLSGPTSGGAATPNFRLLVPADYPTFVASGASHAAGAVPDPGGAAGTTKFLREDATFAVPPGGATAQDRYDALWQKDYFVDNSLLPATNFKNSNSTWPTFDFSNTSAGHTLSTDLAVEKDALSGAAVNTSGNGGWDIGAGKTKVLAVIGGMYGGGANSSAGQQWVWVAQSQPSTAGTATSPVKSGFLFLFDVANSRFILYRTDSSGNYTNIGAYGSTTLIAPPAGPNAYPPSAAILFDGSGHTVQCFIRFNGSQWFRVLNISDSTYSTMRYAGILAGATGTMTTDMLFFAPVQVWYTT